MNQAENKTGNMLQKKPVWGVWAPLFGIVEAIVEAW